MEDEGFEVDLLDELNGPGLKRGSVWADAHQGQGGDDSEQHCADGDGQLEPARTDPAEESSDGDEHAG